MLGCVARVHAWWLEQQGWYSPHPWCARTCPEQALLQVDRRELIAGGIGRLRATEKQKAAAAQREVEPLKDLLLRLAVQGNEQIAAADQVEAGEGRVAKQIVGGEDHAVSDFGADAVAAWHLGEEAA